MSKALKIGGMAVFWISSFALVTVLLRMKHSYGVDGESAGTQSATSSSNSDKSGSAPPSGTGSSGGSGSKGGSSSRSRSSADDSLSDDPEVAASQKAKALFEVPAPIDFDGFNELLLELQGMRTELEQKEIVLAEREKAIDRREEEVSHRESAILDKLRTATPRTANTDKPVDSTAWTADPDGLQLLADSYGDMAKSDSKLVVEALSELPPAHAAKILELMERKARVGVLQAMDPALLNEINLILLGQEQD